MKKQDSYLSKLEDNLKCVKSMLLEEMTIRYDNDYDKRTKTYRIVKEKQKRQKIMIDALMHYQNYLLGQIAEESQKPSDK